MADNNYSLVSRFVETHLTGDQELVVNNEDGALDTSVTILDARVIGNEVRYQYVITRKVSAGS